MDILSINIDQDLLTIQYNGTIYQRKTLDLANVNVIDVIPITDISIVSSIPMIWEYDWLAQFYNLQRLSIRGIGLPSGARSDCVLRIGDNRTTLVENLHLLPDIDTIILDNIGLYEFPDIRLLNNLKELDVSNNYISNISTFDRHDLVILSINNNYLKSLDGLEVFYELQELHANNNHIRDITSIEGVVTVMNSLYQLQLDNNFITDASILDTLSMEAYEQYRISIRNNYLNNIGLPMISLNRSNVIIDARNNAIDELPVEYIANMTGIGSWELILTINGDIDSDRLNEIVSPYQDRGIEERWLIQSDGEDVRIFYASA